MLHSTLKARVAALMKKSRQAFRLYSGVPKGSPSNPASIYIEGQAKEWQKSNLALQHGLIEVLQLSSSKEAGTRLGELREELRLVWRTAERDEHLRHSEVEDLLSRSDYLTALVLCGELVILRSRRDAFYATYREVVNLLRALGMLERGTEEEPANSHKSTQPELVAGIEQNRVIPLSVARR